MHCRFQKSKGVDSFRGNWWFWVICTRQARSQTSKLFFFFFLGGQNTDLIFCLIAEKVVEKEEILSKIKKSFMFRSLFASFVKNTKRAGLDC